MSKIVVTAANSPYFMSLLTLISSIHLHSYELVNKIIVYNLGLHEEEITRLKNIKKVSIVEFPSNLQQSHQKFLEPKQHVYKLHCVKNAEEYGASILWLDAGVMALKPLDIIFDVIEKEDIFLVGDTHLNKNFTHKKCIEIMNASEQELSDTQLSSGILGYKVGGSFQNLINDSYKYSLVEGCVDGDESNHRHDQSVYSILASRYNAKKQDIDIYGYWTDSRRNLNTARENNAVIFVHRNGHWDAKDIQYENN